MFKKSLLTATAIFLVTGVAQARETISIVGSSTVYPFATVVAEVFGNKTSFTAPKIESTGSGGGFKLFCAGLGVEHPDFTNASRAIKAKEVKLCQENGVTEVTEVKIGYDGIVFANSKQGDVVDLTRKQIFQALAKDVEVDGKLVANPYKAWSDIDASLPAEKIEVLGPPPSSGTRDAFVELVMHEGCAEFESIASLKKTDKSKFKAVCNTMREDGGFVEAGENDNLIVQKLNANPAAFGIFGFSFLEANSDKIQGAKIEGTIPTFDNIADGSYQVSRPLFFYVKNQHVDTIPGMQEYVNEFVSDDAVGEEGYLADIGLIPAPEDEFEQLQETVASLKVMDAFTK
jgi:phosphate transport system substrate-binding protein